MTSWSCDELTGSHGLCLTGKVLCVHLFVLINEGDFDVQSSHYMQQTEAGHKRLGIPEAALYFIM